MKNLAALIILILIASGVHSQKSTEYTCIPNYQLKTALKKIEQGKADSAELILVKDELKDSERLRSMQQKFIVDLQTLTNYQKIFINNQAINEQALKTELRKQKRKTKIVLLGGVAVSTSLLYIIFK